MNIDFEASFRRIDEIVGNEQDATKASELWLNHLCKHLELPCEVSGVEDFRWEEPYVLGVADRTEYRRLCRQQPSYRDVFTLDRLEPNAAGSEWSMHADDIGAVVTRKADGRPFVLGLSELRAAEPARNAQLLQDYCVWFINYR